MEFGNQKLLVASLADIIKSKRAEGRNKDLAVPTFWSKHNVSKKNVKKAKRSESANSELRKESDRALVEQIRRLLALPMNKRTNFLRVRHPGGGSHL